LTDAACPVTGFSFPVAETLFQLLAHDPLLPGIQTVIEARHGIHHFRAVLLHGLQPQDLPTENMMPASLIQTIVARNPKLSRIIKKAGQDDRLMISRVLAVMERDFGVIRKIKIGKQGGGLAYLLMTPYNPSMYSV